MSWQVLGDWGTTRLRLFRVENGAVVDRIEGAGALAINPAQTLRGALAGWLRDAKPDFIHLCGMAGARTGLREAPYVNCPADVADWRRSALNFDFDSVATKIAPGVGYTDSDGRPDMMRGEETQIFGALRLSEDLCDGAHMLVLPGTHSKWVRLEGGRIVAIQTFITGELFALLRQSSLLAGAASDSTEEFGFAAGLARAKTSSGAGALFEARAAQLRAGRSGGWAHGFVSGVLIGEEIAAARCLAPTLDRIVLIGAPSLAARYASALDGVNVRRLDGDACALAGLELLNADD